MNLTHHHARDKHPGNLDDVNNRMPIKWYKTVSTCMFHESWLLFSEARHWLPRILRLIKLTKKDFYLYSVRVKRHFPLETASRYHVLRLTLFKTTIHVKPNGGLGTFVLSERLRSLVFTDLLHPLWIEVNLLIVQAVAHLITSHQISLRILKTRMEFSKWPVSGISLAGILQTLFAHPPCRILLCSLSPVWWMYLNLQRISLTNEY
jgi:hypothetical protein